MKNNSNNLRMNNTNDILNLLCLIGLFVLVFFTAISENKRLKDVGNKVTKGNINTLLILVIIVLVMTENLQVGFLLLVIYTILLFRFNKDNNKEGFKPGPSPLDCKTYGDSNKKVGSAFYPLHEQDEE